MGRSGLTELDLMQGGDAAGCRIVMVRMVRPRGGLGEDVGSGHGQVRDGVPDNGSDQDNLRRRRPPSPDHGGEMRV